MHELIIFKLQPGAASADPVELLSLSEKKFAKQAEFAMAVFAPPGQTGSSIRALEPGQYLGACFLPVGGKKRGEPHFAEGMYVKFEVR